MSPSISWNSSTWPQLRAAAEDDAVVVVPLGATEQHGPHLPVETDALIATRLAEAGAAHARVPVVVAPTLGLGYSPYHRHLAGTISLRHETQAHLLRDVASSIHHHGFRRLLLLNAHGGNGTAIDAAVNDLAEENIFAAAVSWWSLAGDLLDEVLESADGGANHACELETSVMLHLAPTLVRLDEATVELGRAESPWGWRDFRKGRNGPVTFPLTRLTRSTSGVYGDPSLASAAKGQRIVGHVVAEVARLLDDLSAWRPDTAAPAHSGRAMEGERQ